MNGEISREDWEANVQRKGMLEDLADALTDEEIEALGDEDGE